ncbi:hypothetical protein BaRGS_00027405 [Batillaria attramentaria]|uniref:Uncharacterized protein n=1 Tax=Batillaria attramentaria TaxID=370345 RepID=A0ABD0K1P4_9CAEN
MCPGISCVCKTLHDLSDRLLKLRRAPYCDDGQSSRQEQERVRLVRFQTPFYGNTAVTAMRTESQLGLTAPSLERFEQQRCPRKTAPVVCKVAGEDTIIVLCPLLWKR